MLPVSIDQSADQSADYAKFSLSLEKVLSINSSLADETIKKVFVIQQRLQFGQACQIQPSESIPAKFVVTSWALHCLHPQPIGKGTHSEVYFATVIPIKRHQMDKENFSPAKPKSAALKMTRKNVKTFSPEKRNLEKALANGSDEGIDNFLETYKDCEGFGMSLNRLYEANLKHADFHLRNNPVLDILTVLISSARGLLEIHQSNFVHRDIKGGNLLARFEQPATSQSSIIPPLGKNTTHGVITDFGMLKELQADAHFTSCTPDYVDPSQFGSPEMSIFNQKKRFGIQTKEGDIFALGITIWKDVIERFILEISKNDSVIEEQVQKILEKLKVKPLKGPFREDHLKEYGKISNYRMAHSYNRDKVEIIIRHRPLETVREVLMEACSALSSLLEPQEIIALNDLSLLSCKMQEVEIIKDENTGQLKPDYAKRPSIQSVITEMKRILTAFKDTDPVKKRRLDLSSAEDEDKPLISLKNDE